MSQLDRIELGIMNLVQAQKDRNHALVEENATLKEHKERYPPDFIYKLQQDIDERDVTIARLAKENTELLIVLDLFVLKGAPGGSGG